MCYDKIIYYIKFLNKLNKKIQSPRYMALYTLFDLQNYYYAKIL